MTLSAYDRADSRPDFDDWRDSIRIEIAAADNSAAHNFFASLPALDGLVGAGAGRHPEKAPGSVHSLANKLLHNTGV
jgi:hypothetical protein